MERESEKNKPGAVQRSLTAQENTHLGDNLGNQEQKDEREVGNEKGNN